MTKEKSDILDAEPLEAEGAEAGAPGEKDPEKAPTSDASVSISPADDGEVEYAPPIDEGPIKTRWNSRTGMLLALVGSAVGIGNLVRFPYLVATFGGGTFILIYLLSTLFLAFPMLVVTLAAGRAHRTDAKGVYRKLGLGELGDNLGYLLIVGMVLNTIFLFIVASWGTGYIMFAATEGYEDHTTGGYFDSFLDSGLPLLFYLIVLIVGTYVVAKGVGQGIEAACKPMMAGLLLLLVLVLFKAMTFEGPEGNATGFIGEAFGFQADALSEPKLWLFSIGHAFFSLSLGMGTMITYGSYLSREEDIMFSGAKIVAADVGVALLAGLAILPASLAMGYDWETGEQSVDITFETLPRIFLEMPGGALLGTLFFTLVVIGALTSVFSTIEAVVAWLVSERGWKRPRAAWTVGAVSLLPGMALAVSTDRFFGLDYFRSVIGIPITLGLIYAMMFVWGEDRVTEELERSSRWKVPGLWMRIFKYAALPVMAGATILSFF